MTIPLICTSFTRPANRRDLVAENKKLRYENALLRSEMETLTIFMAKLISCIRQFPQASAFPSSPWLYAMVVMSILSHREVVSLARLGDPMWTNERLNLSQYYSKFFPWYAKNVPEFVHEASRASALVPSDAESLVATLMDHACWQKIFPSIIADVSMESQNQILQMINMDFMPPTSPLTETRNVKLLRYAKQIEMDTWVIADFSVYFSSYAPHLRPPYMRFPSGFLVQNIINGVSKVTVVDHWVYKEEEDVNRFNSNLGQNFGAQRWLAALERHCYETYFMSNPSIGNNIQSSSENYVFDPICKSNLLDLSTKMIYAFCTGVCRASGQKWKWLGRVNNTVIFTRDVNGVPYVFVSANGVARMQGKPETIFGLINCAKAQDIWNYLSPIVRDMKEVIRIKRSPIPGNEVSVFSIEFHDGFQLSDSSTGICSKEWYMVQETYVDASSAMIIHLCVEGSILAAIINGGDFSGVHFFPSGITILPSGPEECVVSAGCQMMTGNDAIGTGLDDVANNLGNMITNTLRNVANALPGSSGLP